MIVAVDLCGDAEGWGFTEYFKMTLFALVVHGIGY